MVYESVSKKIFLYALINPIDSSLFYVGITNSPDRRLSAHANPKAKSEPNFKKRRIVNRLRKQGLKPLMEILGEFATREEANAAEIQTIQFVRELTGNTLTNLDNGGGTKCVSEEQKAKQSAAMTGRKLTEDHKRAISEATKGKKLAASHIEKLKKPKSPEHNEKVRLSKLGKPRSEETKAKISAGRKLRYLNQLTQKRS